MGGNYTPALRIRTREPEHTAGRSPAGPVQRNEPAVQRNLDTGSADGNAPTTFAVTSTRRGEGRRDGEGGRGGGRPQIDFPLPTNPWGLW